MDDVYGGRQVSIVAPYDKSVGATVLEESLPVWLAAGWTVGAPEAPAPAEEAPVEAAASPSQPAPAPVEPAAKPAK